MNLSELERRSKSVASNFAIPVRAATIANLIAVTRAAIELSKNMAIKKESRQGGLLCNVFESEEKDVVGLEQALKKLEPLDEY